LGKKLRNPNLFPPKRFKIKPLIPEPKAQKKGKKEAPNLNKWAKPPKGKNLRSLAQKNFLPSHKKGKKKLELTLRP